MGRRVDSKVLRKLDEWQEKAETPPELVEFYRRLLSIQSRAQRRVGIPRLDLSSKAISDRLEHGLPLIGFGELDLDWSLLQDIFVEVISAFARYPKLFGPVPDSIVAAGKGDLLKEAARAWFEGTRLPKEMLAMGVSEYLLTDMIQATLKPFLASYSKALLGCVDRERWRRGHCPICGGNPDFAFLDEEHGARWLVCCRCDAEWLFQRLECPYCGNQDQNNLAYFTDDDGLYRLYVCEQCKQYLKAIDLRQAKDEFMISLERLFTLGMDVQAREYGYGHSNKPGSKRRHTKVVKTKGGGIR